ncbi:MAG TPA: Smr/MutS family protein, partial [Thermoanaerobaculia bacterium]|nr:Smr/MutS family protein [Thermoanaerobaculia bacterium]
ERLEKGRAEVLAGGKRLRCAEDELVALAAPATARAPRQAAPPDLPAAPEVPAELHLIGERVEPALDRLDDYLDAALRSHRGEVRVVHGHGSGRLRQAVRAHLARHPAVASHRPGEPGEGGNGATVVILRG